MYLVISIIDNSDFYITDNLNHIGNIKKIDENKSKITKLKYYIDPISGRTSTIKEEWIAFKINMDLIKRIEQNEYGLKNNIDKIYKELNKYANYLIFSDVIFELKERYPELQL